MKSLGFIWLSLVGLALLLTLGTACSTSSMSGGGGIKHGSTEGDTGDTATEGDAVGTPGEPGTAGGSATDGGDLEGQADSSPDGGTGITVDEETQRLSGGDDGGSSTGGGSAGPLLTVRGEDDDDNATMMVRRYSATGNLPWQKRKDPDEGVTESFSGICLKNQTTVIEVQFDPHKNRGQILTTASQWLVGRGNGTSQVKIYASFPQRCAFVAFCDGTPKDDDAFTISCPSGVTILNLRARSW